MVNSQPVEHNPRFQHRFSHNLICLFPALRAFYS